MPFLHRANQITVVVVMTYEHPAEGEVIMGTDSFNHLKHHGIDTVLHRINSRPGDVEVRSM
jgi:hypothetical protein